MGYERPSRNTRSNVTKPSVDNNKKNKQAETTKSFLTQMNDAYEEQERLCNTLKTEVQHGIRDEKDWNVEKQKLEEMKKRMEAQANVSGAPTDPVESIDSEPMDIEQSAVDTEQPKAAKSNTAETKDLRVNTKFPKPAKLNTIKDALGIEWHVDLDDSQIISPLEGLETAVIGHFVKLSRVYYVQRYGDPKFSSARVSSELPEGSKYNLEVDVMDKDMRILENILEKHKSQLIPARFTRKKAFTVMLIYWDGKEDYGYTTDVGVLKPYYGRKRRPSTRCYIRMNPALYQEYGLKNDTGFSHETRSTVKRFLAGKDDWARSTVLHNIAVTRENMFEQTHLSHVESRSDQLPLEEIIDEKASQRATSIKRERTTSPNNVQPRRSSRLAPAILQQDQTAASIKRETSTSPIDSQRQKSLHPAPQNEASVSSEVLEPRRQYLKDFLELHDLDKATTADDIPEKYQSRYDAGYTKWKKENQSKN
jgi:hypothetical protein